MKMMLKLWENKTPRRFSIDQWWITGWTFHFTYRIQHSGVIRFLFFKFLNKNANFWRNSIFKRSILFDLYSIQWKVLLIMKFTQYTTALNTWHSTTLCMLYLSVAEKLYRINKSWTISTLIENEKWFFFHDLLHWIATDNNCFRLNSKEFQIIQNQQQLHKQARL